MESRCKVIGKNEDEKGWDEMRGRVRVSESEGGEGRVKG